jgi:hypothetical protein
MQLEIINNKDEKGRVLTYTLIDIDKPFKNYFEEFNSLREARARKKERELLK